jgi:hypothetical protein
MLSLDTSVLDNPILNALSTEHSGLALGGKLAKRYPPAIGPLSGIVEQSVESYESLRQLAGAGGTLALFLQEKPAPPAGWTLIRGGPLDQMISLEPVSQKSRTLASSLAIRPLTSAHVPAMVALAELTEPGPFRDRTSELGAFFGIFEDQRLLAMAGQRLHLPDFVEVSAVCTHPDARGRGYARILIDVVVQEIRSRNKTPILHTFSDNHSAVRVYESLGFRVRRNFQLAVLKNEA